MPELFVWWLLGTVLTVVIGVVAIRVLMAKELMAPFDARSALALLLCECLLWPVAIPLGLAWLLGVGLHRILCRVLKIDEDS